MRYNGKAIQQGNIATSLAGVKPKMSVFGYRGTPRSNDEWCTALGADASEQQMVAFEELADFLRRRIFKDVYQRAYSLPALAQLANAELEEVTDEIVQESLIRIYEKLDTFSDTGNFLNFALVIARNLMIDEFRRKRWTVMPLPAIAPTEGIFHRGQRLPALDQLPDTRQLLDNANAALVEMMQIVLDAIHNDLSPAQATAFVAYEFYNLSSKEIAAHIGKSPSAIDQLRFQARVKIKKRLELHGYALEDLTTL